MEYREVVEHLAPFYRIDPPEIGAFKSQLHMFRKIGVPKLEAVGKGKREAFDLNHLAELHLAMTLHRIGLAPAGIASIVESVRSCEEWWPLSQWTDHYLYISGRQGTCLMLERFGEDGLAHIIGPLGWCSIIDLRPIARDLRRLASSTSPL
jgi:hypothetical protein